MKVLKLAVIFALFYYGFAFFAVLEAGLRAIGK